jgi:hypothetical protein
VTHIAIIFPSGDLLHSDFCSSLVNMVAYSQRIGLHLSSINPKGSIIQVSRYLGVKTALDNNADKILFIDSDQTFKHDALERLLSHNKPIVGAASLTRREPIRYTCKDENGKRIDFSQKTGLVEVCTNGFPMTLIDCEVFSKIPKPWFNVTYDNRKWTGEDESFCHAARKEGYSIFIDADVKIGHLGVKEYI